MELRTLPVDEEAKAQIQRNDITIILDNILDTYNTGSIFRLADAVAAKKVYLCGMTETPPNTRIKKASINTWQWVPWEYTKTTTEAIERFRQENPSGTVVAVEQDQRSIPFYSIDYRLPIALVVGNETTGVAPDVLSSVDAIVELPMFGINKSLNVMVTTGIVLYDVAKRMGLPTPVSERNHHE